MAKRYKILRVEEDQYEQIRELADEDGRSITGMAKKLLEGGIDALAKE